jgi:hypothetical protein
MIGDHDQAADAVALTRPTTDVRTAGRLLGMGPTKSYQLVRDGRFPCRVEKIGNRYRVIRGDLRRVLGLDQIDASAR